MTAESGKSVGEWIIRTAVNETCDFITDTVAINSPDTIWALPLCHMTSYHYSLRAPHRRPSLWCRRP
jgi:hypothetical protein